MGVDVSIRIGGQAGQGMQSISFIMGKIFTRHGYYVFINQDVESRIRGGHNFNQIRVKDEPVHAINDKVELLIALDGRTIDQDLPHLIEDGVLIFDGTTTGFTSDNPNHLPVPLEKLATEAGKSKSKIMVNSVATGAALALLGYDLQPLLDRLEEEFTNPTKRNGEPKGWYLQAGYFIKARKLNLEPTARYEEYDQDSNASDKKQKVWTVGANWYAKGHTLKISANWVHTEFERSASGRLTSDDDKDVFRLRAQFYF